MTITHLLEDFGMPAIPAAVEAAAAAASVTEEVVEEARLVSFENGYSAGWDDAVTAQDKDTQRISATLASSLEDMSFTYHEAQTQMMDNLDPLFKVLTGAILPDVMAASFGHHIVDQLNEMAKGQTGQPFVISVAAGEGAGVRAVLTQNFPVEVKVREDAGLGPGQAQLRIGDAEREIDSEALLGSISESVEAFSYQVQEEAHYG